jgi:hypothetical protein
MNQSERSAFEQTVVGGMMQMVEMGGSAETIARTFFQGEGRLDLVATVRTSPQTYFGIAGNVDHGIQVDPRFIQNGFMSDENRKKFEAANAELGTPIQAFALVLGHEFAHRYLNVSDPALGNEGGAVLLF